MAHQLDMAVVVEVVDTVVAAVVLLSEHVITARAEAVGAEVDALLDHRVAEEEAATMEVVEVCQCIGCV